MSKHPIVPGTDLKTIRDLLVRHEKARNRYLLATTLELLPRPPEEADALLRQIAGAGYIEWVGSPYKDWELTPYGFRLAADDLGPRLSREAVDEIVATVVGRARAVNEDKGHIARITEIRLFGSALDSTREDYGDVDVDVRINTRKLPHKEVSEARAEIATRVPQSWRDSFFSNLNAEENYDRRNVTKDLARGIKGLSLSSDATDTLGCEYRCIYSFDIEAGEEVPCDPEIVPRTTPKLKSAVDISPTAIPPRTIIQPLGLVAADQSLPSSALSIRMEDLAFHEAAAWLGQSKPDGSYTPIDTKLKPHRRFAGARFLFDEWRDPRLSGLELFKRTLDWSAHYKLPISKASRAFTLRTYDKTRVANFHALMVQRVADRIEADLVLRPLDRSMSHRPRPGSSARTTPRMVAAHHSLAIALARMLDETRLTGQVDFRAEFDLTVQQKNYYPALPDLSDVSRVLRRSLPKVTFPDEVLAEARSRKQDYETYLPIKREFQIGALLDETAQEATAFASAKLGAEWWDQEPIEIDDDGYEVVGFLPGEEQLVVACEPFLQSLKGTIAELPGCRLLSISHKAPIK
ncbi:hypothetical protein IB276_05820 [Ensifer sp. ENS04]|uniref:hypothetical protein n=1 Tax=Ensifer sp. ENS04 TaxID=2769281 RepID=UPI001785A55C|nr:hypothetical protein [Ensifer sp. ENS04]MBD9538958.1 hypothetical protein [Ensifer sp. ENS04]